MAAHMRIELKNLLFFASVVLVTQTSVARAYDEKKCTVLKVTAHPDNPPYSQRLHNKLVGIHIDLAKKLAATVGVEISVHYTGHWNRVQARVASGKIDIIAGLYKNKARLKLYDYTVSYTDDLVSIASLEKTKIPYTGSWPQLIPFRGASMLGNSYGEKLDAYMASTLKPQRVPTLDSLMNLLIYGRVDYIVHTRSPMQQALVVRNLSALIKIDAEPIAVEPVYIAFSKKSPCRHLVSDFSKAIYALFKSGAIDKIFIEKWALWMREQALSSGRVKPPNNR